MKKLKVMLSLLLLGGLIALAPTPAYADGGVGVGICFGGNHGTSVHVFVGQGQFPGWGWGWGNGSPNGLNGTPNWGAGGYGMCPPRPYPQPIPEDSMVEMKVPTYGWTVSKKTGERSYGIVGWHKELVKVHRYLYP